MKGIILAAGLGTRLYPATFPVSKILLTVYDRPMIYYPLNTLIDAGIREILIISNERDLESFKRTLGDGSDFGVRVDYMIQYVQRGISDAFIIAKDWIGEDEVSLILGDNIFYRNNDVPLIEGPLDINSGAIIFGYRVHDPERFGVIGFDEKMTVTSLEEKPKNPKSDYVAVGIYFYGKDVCRLAEGLKPSSRGELEITDLNIEYLHMNKLSVRLLDDEVKWIDAGTFDSLLDASLFIRDEEKELGRKIMCPELTAFRKGYITKDKLIEKINSNGNSEYYKSIERELTNS